jgi:hypothetical protein
VSSQWLEVFVAIQLVPVNREMKPKKILFKLPEVPSRIIQTSDFYSSLFFLLLMDFE